MKGFGAISASEILLIAFVAGASAQQRPAASLADLKTRAERTNFDETSRYDDVVSFLDGVADASSLVHLTTFGYSFEGRSLPLAVIGRVANARPETVRASGRLRIYIQANVHAGEVEGKEAMLALTREIARGRYAEWLESAARSNRRHRDARERAESQHQPRLHQARHARSPVDGEAPQRL
jgi:hypothetical protein